jgi:hypothetical protein
MAKPSTIPHTDATDTPVVVSFKVHDRTGETLARFDDWSDCAVGGGYDALRLRNTSEDDTMKADAHVIVQACAPRALVAAREAVRVSAALATVNMVPGGSREGRLQARAAIKAALRAHRVAKG